jgi:hypothetical protein
MYICWWTCTVLQQKAISVNYNKNMGYVDKVDRITNTYSISHQTWKWAEILYFHLLNLMILNSFILLCITVTSRLSSRPCRKHAGACCKGSPSPTVSHRFTPCSVNYNISPRGGHLLSLANLLSQENKLACLFSTWEVHQVQEMQCWIVDSQVLWRVPLEGKIHLDDVEVNALYTSSR